MLTKTSTRSAGVNTHHGILALCLSRQGLSHRDHRKFQQALHELEAARQHHHMHLNRLQRELMLLNQLVHLLHGRGPEIRFAGPVDDRPEEALAELALLYQNREQKMHDMRKGLRVGLHKHVGAEHCDQLRRGFIEHGYGVQVPEDLLTVLLLLQTMRGGRRSRIVLCVVHGRARFVNC